MAPGCHSELAIAVAALSMSSVATTVSLSIARMSMASYRLDCEDTCVTHTLIPIEFKIDNASYNCISHTRLNVEDFSNACDRVMIVVHALL